MTSNPLEQLKSFELKANFTPRERQYFYKLRDELEVIVGGVSIEKLDKPGDVAQAKRIRTKLEEILKFVQDRKMKKIEVVDTKSFMEWVEEFNLQEQLSEEWVDKNMEFRDEGIICKGDFSVGSTAISYLPDNLQILDSLDLDGCTRLMSLPDNLKVQGHLSLEGCTGLMSLPESLKVNGSLILRGCTGLTSLPDNITMEADVYVMGVPAEVIAKLKELEKRGQIKGWVSN